MEVQNDEKYSFLIHDMHFWVFYFPKQEICAQRCGRMKLESMAVVEIISSY